MDDGLSLDPARALVGGGGGGGYVEFEAGSGDDLYRFAGESRLGGDMPERASSFDMIDARWLRGGE